MDACSLYPYIILLQIFLSFYGVIMVQLRMLNQDTLYKIAQPVLIFTNKSNNHGYYFAPEYIFSPRILPFGTFSYPSSRHNFVVFQTITFLVYFLLCNAAASHLRSVILTFHIFYSFHFSVLQWLFSALLIFEDDTKTTIYITYL